MTAYVLCIYRCVCVCVRADMLFALIACVRRVARPVMIAPGTLKQTDAWAAQVCYYNVHTFTALVLELTAKRAGLATQKDLHDEQYKPAGLRPFQHGWKCMVGMEVAATVVSYPLQTVAARMICLAVDGDLPVNGGIPAVLQAAKAVVDNEGVSALYAGLGWMVLGQLVTGVVKEYVAGLQYSLGKQKGTLE